MHAQKEFSHWVQGTTSLHPSRRINYSQQNLPSPCRVSISLATLQLGLEHLPTGFAGRDGGGAGGVHESPLQHTGPVLLARGQVALAPRLEVILALSCRETHKSRKQTTKSKAASSGAFVAARSQSSSPPLHLLCATTPRKCMCVCDRVSVCVCRQPLNGRLMSTCFL